MLHKLRQPSFALLILPLIYVGLAVFQVNKLQPLYFGADIFDYDAAYAYLISSVSLTIGDVPYYADHPGTLNHIILAFSLRCFQLFMVAAGISSNQCATTSCIALDHSEAVLDLAGNIALSLYSLSIFVWGWALYKASLASLWVSCLSQAVFLSALNLLPFFKIINGETTGVPLLLISASICILSNTLTASKKNSNKTNGTRLIVGGVLSGAYMSLTLLSKLSFLPAIFVLGLNYSNSAFIASLISTVTGFFFWGMAFTNWTHFKQYWLSIATHTGNYAGGEKGFIDLQRAMESMTIIARNYPFIVIAIIALCASLVATLRIVPSSSIANSCSRSGTRLAAAAITAYGLAYCKSNFQILILAFSSLLISIAFRKFYPEKDTGPTKNTPGMQRNEHSYRLANLGKYLDSLIIISACQLVSIAAVVKHYDARYLLAPLAITAISLGLALGSLESCKEQISKVRDFAKFTMKIITVATMITIAVQGTVSQNLLFQQIRNRNKFMNHDEAILAQIRSTYPNAVIVGEYRIKGIREYAKAFAFLMGTNHKKAAHIMSFYSDPSQRFWVWLSGETKIWNSQEGIMNISEFARRNTDAIWGKDFIFAIPENNPLPPIKLRKLAKLEQKATLFLYTQELN